MEVFIRLKDIANKLVTIEIRALINAGTLVSFPTWRPGRYEQTNYMSNISNVSLALNNSLIQPIFHSISDFELPFFQGKKELKLSFTVFCNEMNAGSSYIDEDQWYFNFINFIPCIKGKESESVSVIIDYPSGFQVYSALKRTGDAFVASSYYELVDAPFLASRFLAFYTFKINETTFQLAINNTELIELPEDRLIDDFTKLALPQKELFGSFPFKTFTYLIQLLPYKTYHGVEHKNCTVITIGPTEKAINGDWYKELLGVSSHELFHCWNVTRLRPKEMVPYDFSKQQIHTTGFVTEGFTSYYGDLMLIRGGVFSLEEYLEEINTYLKRYLENPAYKTTSMVASSISLWANGYKAGPPFNHVSIYIKGALLALLLDLKLRKQGTSLDKLMQLLWHEFLEEGYTYDDIISTINKLQNGLGDLFSEKYYYGLEDVVSALEKELQELGIMFNYENHTEKITDELGVLLSPDKRISYVDPESPVKDCLCVGDEIVEYSSSVIKIKRMGLEKEYTLRPEVEKVAFFSLPKLSVAEGVSELQKEKLKNWLGESHG